MYKKICISLMIICISPYFAFANTGPMSNSLGSGGLEFDSGSIMAKNVSVEKHILLFKTSNKNLYQSGAQYLGYNFLKTKLGFSQEYIENNTIPDDNYLNFDGTGNSVFIKKDYGCDYSDNALNDYYCNDSINIAVRYYLKNNSNIKIEKQKIGFSFMKNFYINAPMLSELENEKNISDKEIYILNNENSYPKNFKVYEGKSQISSKEEFYIQKFSTVVFDKKINSVNKVSTFDLSFQPNETKILTITYSLPYKIAYAGGKYIDYDYSPIFNWKDGVVKKSYIAVIGDNNNILNTSETYIDRNINKEYAEQKSLFFKRIGKHSYSIYLENVDKNKYIDNLQIGFSNIEDIKSRGCGGMGGMQGEVLNKENESGQYYCETIEIIPSLDREKAIIKELKNIQYENAGYNKTFEYSGKEYEINIFDLLK